MQIGFENVCQNKQIPLLLCHAMTFRNDPFAWGVAKAQLKVLFNYSTKKLSKLFTEFMNSPK